MLVRDEGNDPACLATAYHEYRHVCIMDTGEWFAYEDVDRVPELLVALGIVDSLDEIDG